MNQKYKYGKIIVAAYGGLGLLGTFFLLLPWASTQPGPTSFIQAWVTAISALTVTGLTIVNTGSHWSLFGQAVILILIQIGGLGLIVLTTLLLIMLGYRMNLGYRNSASFVPMATSRLEKGDVIVIFGKKEKVHQLEQENTRE